VLTDLQCKNAVCSPGKPRARLADSGGLYLEVSPAGSKRWFFKFRNAGKEHRLALGGYPTVGLAAARRARDAAKLQKAEGQVLRQPGAAQKGRGMTLSNLIRKDGLAHVMSHRLRGLWGMNGLMAVAAVRYSLGRMTYITNVCADWLITEWHNLPEEARQSIQRDVESAFREDDEARKRGDHFRPLGWDCDRYAWAKVRKLWQ